MSKVTNAKILYKLWEEGKVFALPLFQNIKNIKQSKYKGFTEVTVLLPDDFINTSDLFKSNKIHIGFAIDKGLWDSTYAELNSRAE